MKLFLQKKLNFRVLGAPAAGGFAPNPQPPAAGGFAPRPPQQPPIANFWLRACLPTRRHRLAFAPRQKN